MRALVPLRQLLGFTVTMVHHSAEKVDDPPQDDGGAHCEEDDDCVSDIHAELRMTLASLMHEATGSLTDMGPV